MAKKTGKKTTAKATAEKIVEAVKEESQELVEIAAPAVEETKAEVITEIIQEETKKPAATGKRGRRPAAVNTEKAKNTKSAQKTDKKPVKAEDKKDEKETSKELVFVQYAGNEVVVEEVMEQARQMYIAEGHKASSIKSLRLYIKPEEMMAYYVINENSAGRIQL